MLTCTRDLAINVQTSINITWFSCQMQTWAHYSVYYHITLYKDAASVHVLYIICVCMSICSAVTGYALACWLPLACVWMELSEVFVLLRCMFNGAANIPSLFFLHWPFVGQLLPYHCKPISNLCTNAQYQISNGNINLKLCVYIRVNLLRNTKKSHVSQFHVLLVFILVIMFWRW